MTIMNVKKTGTALTLEATLGLSFAPTKTEADAPAYDIRACIETELIICKRETVTIPVGFAMQLSEPMLSLALPLKGSPIRFLNGIELIAYDCRDELMIKCVNNGLHVVCLSPGEVIGQIMFLSPLALSPIILEVNEFADILNTNLTNNK
jgi:dUTPase